MWFHRDCVFGHKTQGKEVVRLDDIHKRFGSREVLKGVSLKPHEGDVIALIGFSGSGKSTMRRCTNLLEAPTSGRVVIGDEEIRLVARGQCHNDGSGGRGVPLSLFHHRRPEASHGPAQI